MGKPEFITTPNGEERVILDRRDYDALLARAGDEEAEDRRSAAILDASDAAIAEGADVSLPESVWKEIEGGGSAVRVLRRFRGLTQVQLAAAAGLSQSFVADIEGGRRVGTTETLRAIARALRVPLDVLVE